MNVISVSIDEDLLDRFDGVRERSGHVSRSEAIREAIHLFIAAHEKWDALQGTGTFVASASYREDPGVHEEVLDLLDEMDDVVRSTLHYKQEGRTILLLVASGEASRVRELVDGLSTVKSVDDVHARKLW
ncbi:MAG: nickel-responsive transcriptional regulator NikR [Promethearchaeota archaeon]